MSAFWRISSSRVRRASTAAIDASASARRAVSKARTSATRVMDALMRVVLGRGEALSALGDGSAGARE